MRRNLRCRPLLPSLFTYILTSPQPGERPSQLEVIIYPLSHTSQIRHRSPLHCPDLLDFGDIAEGTGGYPHQTP